MPSCHFSMSLISKVLTVLVSILITVISIITVVTLGGFDLSVLFMSIYYILFCIVLILTQFKVMFVLKRFRLLRYELGKAIYCVIIGLLMIQQNKFSLTMVCAIALGSLGMYHIVMMFVCKDRQQQEVDKISQNSSRTAPLQTP